MEKKSGEKEKGMKKKYDLSGVTCYYSNNISGICRFIEVSNENDQPSNDFQLKRFVILNFHGIYNFALLIYKKNLLYLI